MDKANVIMESVDVILDIRENFARTLCVLIIVQLIKIIMKTEQKYLKIFILVIVNVMKNAFAILDSKIINAVLQFLVLKIVLILIKEFVQIMASVIVNQNIKDQTVLKKDVPIIVITMEYVQMTVYVNVIEDFTVQLVKNLATTTALIMEFAIKENVYASKDMQALIVLINNNVKTIVMIMVNA